MYGVLEQIKEIIFRHSRQGMMCDDINDGQILGIRTGKGLELDVIAEELLKLLNKREK